MFHVSFSDGLSHVPDVIFGRLFLCSREIDELLTFSCAYALLPCNVFLISDSILQIVYYTFISTVFCPPLFLHIMYMLSLLYEMLMCAGNKVN